MTEKYDSISGHYNNTRKADGFILDCLLRHLNIESGDTCLEIGCGTGNYAIGLSRKGLNMIGIDPSGEMLKKARARISKVQWMSGRAEEIPLADDSVDGAVAVLTIHHWGDLNRGFGELSRVLRRGRRLVIFTSSPVQMSGYWLNRYFPKMLRASAESMPDPDLFAAYLSKNGFVDSEIEPYFVRENVKDLFLYSGKHRPEIYLDPRVRQGISSFSNLSNADEVNNGLLRLQGDLDNAKIDEVIRNHDNDRGDYLFLTASKN